MRRENQMLLIYNIINLQCSFMMFFLKCGDQIPNAYKKGSLIRALYSYLNELVSKFVNTYLRIPIDLLALDRFAYCLKLFNYFFIPKFFTTLHFEKFNSSNQVFSWYESLSKSYWKLLELLSFVFQIQNILQSA